LAESDRADADEKYAVYAPQIMYVRWVTNRQLSKSEESDRVRQRFLVRFPDHVLGADMHFATATDLLAASDYTAAEKELAFIEDHYPSAPVAKKARDICERLRNAEKAAHSLR
jgi:hypothetical protein